MKRSKEKLTLKKIGNNILDYLSGSLTPLIPMLIGAAMIEAFLAIMGPDMLGVLSAENDLYIILDFVANAAFYFLPIIVGGFAAKKLGATPVLGMFMGGILMHPIFQGLVAEGASISFLGLPVAMNDYSSTIFPILLSVWILSYVERFFNKYIPVSLKVVFAPFFTVLVMTPVALIIVGPIGSIIGNVLFTIINGLGTVPGVGSWFALAIVAAIWEFVVMAGMHWMFIASAAASIAAGGVDSILSPAAAPAGFAVGGMIVGAMLLQKKQEERSLSISYLIAQVIGGLVEPGLYGIGFKYKRPFIGMMAGGFAAGLYNGITGVVAYNMVPVSSVLAAFAFIGGPTSNFVNGIISFVIAFVVAAVVTYFVGLEKKEA